MGSRARFATIPFCALVLWAGGCNPVAGDDPQAGKAGVLNGSGRDVLLAASQADLAEVTRIMLTHDSSAESKMTQSGAMFSVPDRTTAKIVESGPMGGLEVHITSGGSSGRTGWLSADQFVPSQ